MSADIIQSIPRPNPKADRAFWLGPMAMFELQIASLAIMGEIVEQVLGNDPAAGYRALEKDGA